MDTWPTVNMTQISLSEGVYTYNIQVVMPGFNSGTGTKRETGFYINAGNLQHHVLLSQWREDGEWLTSNVELDGNDNEPEICNVASLSLLRVTRERGSGR